MILSQKHSNSHHDKLNHRSYESVDDHGFGNVESIGVIPIDVKIRLIFMKHARQPLRERDILSFEIGDQKHEQKAHVNELSHECPLGE